jgi:NAD(P)-dependent dehydrogenase (short-subunit alcohol dehydrogenase family)
MRALEGQVAVVAGATRGAGRGIASRLGEAGATVYCTGRSVRGRPATEGRSETIEETAELVTELGGRGVWMQVDHGVDEQVEALFARVKRDEGRLDVLVNDVWGGDAVTEWGTPFWELSTEKGLGMLRQAVHTHVITSRHGAPLMIEAKRGLIVEVTDGDFLGYRGNLFYDLVKVGVIRLAYDMSLDLRDRGVTALAVTPGFLRSEAVLDHFGVTEANWREAIQQDPHFAESESPAFVGRSVAALAADPSVASKAGRVWASWTLAREYGFRDTDDRQPDWGRHLDRTIAELLDRDAPLTPDERSLLETRRDQIALDAEQRALGERIARRLTDESHV